MKDPITVYTFWLVCFTGVLAVATIILAVFTVDLARTSKKTAERQLRAYVSARPDYVYAFGLNIPVEIKVRIINHGQTPAYNVAQTAAVDALPYPLPAGFPLPKSMIPAPATLVLHPNALIDTHVTGKRVLSATEIGQVTANHGLRIYVFGTVKYRDAFKQDRETRFCFSVIGDKNLATVAGGVPIPTVDIKFEPSENHNEAN